MLVHVRYIGGLGRERERESHARTRSRVGSVRLRGNIGRLIMQFLSEFETQS